MGRVVSFIKLVPPPGVIRLLVIVVGGVVVLQSSQSLGPPKLVYLGLAGTAFLLSCRAVWALRDRPMFAAARPWLISSICLFGLIALSLPVALAHGTPVTQWLRDAATYGLLAAAPIVALDAASSMRHRLLSVLAFTTMAIGTVAYAMYWIDARSIAVIPFDRLVLPTASLPTALFAISLGASIVDERRRWTWIAVGGIALGIFFFTGSRSALFYLVAFPVLIMVAGRHFIARTTTATAGMALVAIAFVVFVQSAFAIVPRQPSPTESGSAAPIPEDSLVPLPTAPPALNPDATLIARLRAFLASPSRDPSIRERVEQYQVAWRHFASSPFVGTGLGHPFVWTRVDGTSRRDFTADTPLVLPAKLGILGVAWLGLFAYAWIRFVRTVRSVVGITAVGLAMTGWAAIALSLGWGSFILEDKGFSLALMLLLALALIAVEGAAIRART
jgi:hypothetical protein